MFMNQIKKILLGAFFSLASLFIMADASRCDVIISAGQDDGYSGRVMDKIVAKWSPPKQLKNECNIKLSVSLDGAGKVQDCIIRKSSGLQALDVAACAAVRKAAPFGSPPYGMPAEIFLSFWSGSPGNVVSPDPARAALDTSQAEQAREKSVETNERARALAEKAAAKTGKMIPPGVQANAKPKDAAGAEKPDVSKVKAQPEKAAAVGKVVEKAAQREKPVQNNVVPEKPAAAGKVDAKAAQTEKAAQNNPVPEKSVAAAKVDAREKPEVKNEISEEERTKRYISQITWDLRNAMFVPVESKPGVYNATVKLKCDPNGKITDYSIIKSSGDPLVDRYVLMGIKRAGHIIKPPARLGNEFDLKFQLVR